MIAFLSGQIIHKETDSIILNANGVGYHINLPVRLCNGVRVGQVAEFHTHHHVREDIQALYGFQSRDELAFFRQLLNVSGIGPKKAMSVLANADPAAASNAVAHGDPAALAQTTGVSLKIAEKIVLELKGKVIPFEGTQAEGAWKQQQDVVEALVSLGYSPNQAQAVMKKISTDRKDSSAIVKEALQILGGKE